MRPDDHLGDHPDDRPDDRRDAGRDTNCTAALPGLGWREWGPSAGSTGLYMWFRPPEPSLMEAAHIHQVLSAFRWHLADQSPLLGFLFVLRASLLLSEWGREGRLLVSELPPFHCTVCSDSPSQVPGICQDLVRKKKPH